MWANIRFSKAALKMYTLHHGGGVGDVVWAFLNTQEKPAKGHAKALLALIEHVAENGLEMLTTKKRKCWHIPDLVCELRDLPWRLTYFRSDDKVLLVTAFEKRVDQADAEIREALALWREFCRAPDWRG
jgi:hypothetical protein